MKIKVYEMLKFFLHKIRRIERHIQFILKTNDEEALYTDINVDVTEAEMEAKTQKTFDQFNKFKNYENKGTTKKFPQRKNNQGKERKFRSKKKPSEAHFSEEDPHKKEVQEKIESEPELTSNKQIGKSRTNPKMCLKSSKEINNQEEIKTPKEPQQELKILAKKETPLKAINTHQEMADQLKKQGTEQLEAGNYQLAIQRYEEALKLSPHDARIENNICLAYWKESDYQNCYEATIQLLTNNDLKFKNEKMILSMTIMSINCARKLKDYQIAFTLAQKAFQDFPQQETKDLLNKICFEIKKKKEPLMKKKNIVESKHGRM